MAVVKEYSEHEKKLLQILIFIYTLNLNTEEKQAYFLNLIQLASKEDFIREINFLPSKLSITLKDGEEKINVRRLSDENKNLLEEYPNLDDVRRIYQNQDKLSIEKFNKKLGMSGSKAVVGVIHGKDNKEYVHRCISAKVNKEDLIVDYSLNAIIDSNSYNKLFKLVSFEESDGLPPIEELPPINEYYENELFPALDNMIAANEQISENSPKM